MVTVRNYPGSVLVYVLFTTTFFVILISSLKSKNSLGYCFFGIMLWLGFWLKISLHTILSYPFVEGIGFFKGLPDEWDQALIVSTVGGLGFLLSKLLFLNFFSSRDTTVILKSDLPLIYERYRSVLLICTAVLIACIGVTNIVLGITMSGLSAVTILPWPMNAINGWHLYMGFAILVAILANWEFSYQNKNGCLFALACYEGVICSISIISRGLFLFHNLPMLLITFLNRKKLLIDWKKLLLRFAAFAVCFVISSSAVTLLRSSLYGDLYLNTQKYSVTNIFHRMSLLNGKLSLVTSQVSGLVIDRWIGAEGVLAVVAYPKKSYQILFDSLLRVPKAGETDIYEEISQSLYPGREKYTFASMPGPIAFLYYPGNLFLVFGGLFVIGLALNRIDFFIYKYFKNAYLSGLLSFYFANSFSQAGVSPRPLLISFFMTSVGLTIWFFIIRSLPKVAVHSKQ